MIQVAPDDAFHNDVQYPKMAPPYSVILPDMDSREAGDKTVLENTLLLWTRTYTAAHREEMDTNTTYIPLRGIHFDDAGIHTVLAGTLAPLDSADNVMGSNTGGLMPGEHLMPAYLSGHLVTLNRTLKDLQPGHRCIWGPAPRQSNGSDVVVRYKTEDPSVKRVTLYPASRVTWNSLPELQLGQALYNTAMFNQKALEHDFTIWPYYAAIGAAGLVFRDDFARFIDVVTQLGQNLAAWFSTNGYRLRTLGNAPVEAKAVTDHRFKVDITIDDTKKKLAEKCLLKDEVAYWNEFVAVFNASNQDAKLALAQKMWALSETVREARLVARVTNQVQPGGHVLFVMCG
jgi:hypothetical protein